MAGALAVMLLGFGLVIGGIALWSVPFACVVAGVVLFLTGGIEARRRQ